MSLEQALAENTAALKTLAAALAGAGSIGGGDTPKETTSKTTATDKGPFLWANNEEGTFGEEKTLAALNKKLKTDTDAARVTKNVYDQLVAAAAEEEGDGDDDLPTEDDIKRVFGGFLKIDDENKRNKRKAWAKTLLEQFGVEKATELKPEHRAEAIDYIERVLGGEKLDPATANKGGDSKDEEEDSMV